MNIHVPLKKETQSSDEFFKCNYIFEFLQVSFKLNSRLIDLARCHMQFASRLKCI